jgi:hypothetical protein
LQCGSGGAGPYSIAHWPKKPIANRRRAAVQATAVWQPVHVLVHVHVHMYSCSGPSLRYRFTLAYSCSTLRDSRPLHATRAPLSAPTRAARTESEKPGRRRRLEDECRWTMHDETRYLSESRRDRPETRRDERGLEKSEDVAWGPCMEARLHTVVYSRRDQDHGRLARSPTLRATMCTTCTTSHTQ